MRPEGRRNFVQDPERWPRSWRTETNSWVRTCSGSLMTPVGRTCSPPHHSPISRSRSTTRCVDRAGEPRAAQRAPAGLRSRPAVSRADGVAGRDDRENWVRHGRQMSARDILGRTYEYFIREFARAEGHRGAKYFTPAPVARLLVEMLERDQGCGGDGLLADPAGCLSSRRGSSRRMAAGPKKISIYGQERNQATWRIGRMNLAIHGLSGEIKYTLGWVAPRRRVPDAEGGSRDGKSAVQPVGMVHARRSWTTPVGSTGRRQPETPTMPGSSTSCSTWRRTGALGS